AGAQPEMCLTRSHVTKRKTRKTTSAPRPDEPQNRAVSGRFKPGHSGNPGGRPKTKPFRDRIVARIEKGEDLDQIVDLVFKKAKEGEVWAITMLVDRLDGKVPVALMDENNDLAPITPVIRIYGCPSKMSEAEKREAYPDLDELRRTGAID